MEIFIFIWLAFAVCTAVIASNKGRSGFGWFLLGALFGIFALLVVAVSGPADQVTSSLTAQLAELDRLKQRKAITDEEYLRKKASLLA